MLQLETPVATGNVKFGTISYFFFNSICLLNRFHVMNLISLKISRQQMV